MAAQASSSSSTYRFDVFLSFRGEDTRYGFTGNLYSALHHRGICTFIDDEQLGKGEEIIASLLAAIEASRIAIVVLSKNYAASSFCLNELVKITECVEGKKGRLVLPVFYDVDPSLVRHQRGIYAEAMAKHEERLKNDKDKVHKWRMALKQVADLSGYHFKRRDGYEHELIAKIVEQVSRSLRRVALPVAIHPIGLDSQVQKIASLLEVGSNDGVSVVGIHGMGGIGKTTLAASVYNWIVDLFGDFPFEGLCFLENIRENSNKHGLQQLQKFLLFETVREKKYELSSVRQGISILEQRLRRKKILLTLDDVDQQEQLDALAGRSDWFGPGSIIIITTRDKNLLSRYEDKIVYKLEELNKKDALELLSWTALKTNKVDPSYIEVLNDIVAYASGLPLALEIIGSNLVGKSIEQWKSALDQYKRIPNKKIQTILRVSYNGLEEFEKEIFLDIACCFKGYGLAEVKEILCAHHAVVSLDYGLRVLLDKSLMKINGYGEVSLHDLIQDMGREIVRQESSKGPGERSRLWNLEDTIQVFEMNMGSDKIEMIHMDFRMFKKIIKWDGKAFKKMRNLKTLIVRHALFSQGPIHLSNSLRVLIWHEYPSRSLPCDFHPKELVIFHLPGSSLMSAEFLHKRKFMSLTILKLEGSNIKEIPDISGIPNLTELSFKNCVNLVKVHKSVGLLDKLRLLNAQACGKLRSFPLIKLTNLEHLMLSGCSSLKNFPKTLGNIKTIVRIDLDDTLIKEFPSSIKSLTVLCTWSLVNYGMADIPSNIFMLHCLKRTSMVSSRLGAFTRCDMSDVSLPIFLAWFRHVEELDLSGNDFTVLHESINELCSLRSLALNDCKRLQSIRKIPPNLKCFSARNCISLTSSSRSMLLNKELHESGGKMFILPGSSIPNWFEHSNQQDSISFWFRNKCPEISLCVVVSPMAGFARSFIRPELIINGNKDQAEHIEWFETSSDAADHTIIIDLKLLKSKVDEWNHAVCRVTHDCAWEPVIKEIGIHVLKHGSSMEDIRFTDPLLQQKEDVDMA